MNVGHAWADASITGHLMEEILFNEFQRRKYKEDGSCYADKMRLPFKDRDNNHFMWFRVV